MIHVPIMPIHRCHHHLTIADGSDGTAEVITLLIGFVLLPFIIFALMKWFMFCFNKLEKWFGSPLE